VPSGMTVDLSAVEVVDNHCHPIDVNVATDVAGWRGYFTESADSGMQAHDVAYTALYRRLIGRLATFLGADHTEAAVLAAREALSTESWVSRLFDDAGIKALVVDGGYAPAGEVIDGAGMAKLSGCGHAELLRLEVAFEGLIAQHAGLDELIEAADDRLGDLRAAGFSGLKSIAGYRTGLDIERWDRDDTISALAEARHELTSTGRLRLAHKPLVDTLLHVALAQAARQEITIQFHVGYGDSDADLRRVSPLHLRVLFEDPAYRAVPIVMLHGCWPYYREASFLAALYPNAYLDLSYGIPYLGLAELRTVTAAALAAAPWTKLVYSSDGARVPELHWISAHDGRAVLGSALGDLVADGELAVGDAEEVGRMILAGTTSRLYGLA
jgi:uncharacterized protein